MNDPSQGVQRELQPHVHLVSTYRFPQLSQIHPEKVTEWLGNAPKITRDQAPFYWTYLDRPQDGTILLVWQSLSLGVDFPSDGYIWPPQETAFQVESAGGYTLEMYQHKTGYAPGEGIATHTRRRYRLLPSKYAQPGAPQPDPALWIIHYSPADPQERIPSNVIPIDMRVQQVTQTRAYLHSQGQIVQKEFMLHDRQNWPSIAFPRNPQRGPVYGANVPPARIPQSLAYPPQHPTAGPPTKRVRTNTTGGQVGASGVLSVLDVDDEEDTSRGDLFDHTTPREISLARYKQNHEWMEEILSSPYSINQIIPADLGLGVRGEISNLTDGIFDAPGDPDKDTPKNSYVGRLDPEKADQFRKRATEYIGNASKEMERMKAKHAKRLAKLDRGRLLRAAERELRLAVEDPTSVGPEFWRLEGRIVEGDSDEAKPTHKTPAKVSDIVAKVEASVGRHAAAIRALARIQDGGYEEPAALPSPPAAVASAPRISPPISNNGSNHSGVMVGEADLDMSNSAAGLLDQYHTGVSSHATPSGASNNFPTPQPHLQTHSSAGTPSGMHVPSPQPLPQHQQLPPPDNSDLGTSDPSNTAGDWVVVPPGGVSPTQQPQQQQAQQVSAASATAPPVQQQQQIQQVAQQPSTATTTPAPLPHSSVNTPGGDLPDFHTSPNDFADLGDLDTAGEALATYGEGEGLGDLSMDMDVDVGMDIGGAGGDDGLGGDLFGDAFQGHDEGVGGGAATTAATSASENLGPGQGGNGGEGAGLSGNVGSATAGDGNGNGNGSAGPAHVV